MKCTIINHINNLFKEGTTNSGSNQAGIFVRVVNFYLHRVFGASEWLAMEVCTIDQNTGYGYLRYLPLDTCIPDTVLQRRGAISLGSSTSCLTYPRFERRGGISYEKEDQNALYVRMLGDVCTKSAKSENQTEKQRKNQVVDPESQLLEKLIAKDYKVRWSSRFLSLHKIKRQKKTARRISHENNSVLDDTYGEQAECHMSRLGNWNFDIFSLDLMTGGRSVLFISFHLFHKLGLIKEFKLDPVKLIRTFTLIEDGYHDSNPYHNSVHAADVTQAMHCYLQENQLKKSITKLEVMISLLASMTHDLDHPGVNQGFLIATANHLAALYENTSVLENHHWRSAIGVLFETELFSHLERSQWDEIVWQVKSLILATDITRQTEFLNKFKKYLDTDDLDHYNEPLKRHFMLQIALKCADISNPCRQWDLSKQWSERVCDEFFKQGDYERNLQIPVTPMCNKYNTTVAKIQAGFIEFVVNPLFSEWHRFLPTALSKAMLKNCSSNKCGWKEIIEKENQAELAKKAELEKERLEEVCEDNFNVSIQETEPDDLDEEESDTVEEARLPLTFAHLMDDEDGSLYTGSRRGSCRSLSPLREMPEEGWEPEVRRHSMPPSYLGREMPTLMTIRRDTLPLTQYLRRRSLPTAMIVHATSLDKLSGKISALAFNRETFDKRSVSMEELLARPKISNLSPSFETSRLASGLAVFAEIPRSRSHGNSFRFLSASLGSKSSHIQGIDNRDSENNSAVDSDSDTDSHTFHKDINSPSHEDSDGEFCSGESTHHKSFNCVDLTLPDTEEERMVLNASALVNKSRRSSFDRVNVNQSDLVRRSSFDRVNLTGNPDYDSSTVSKDLTKQISNTIKTTGLSQ